MSYDYTDVRCDKCGQLISGIGVKGVMSPGVFTWADWNVIYTLCPACCDRFKRWLEKGIDEVNRI